MSAETRAPLSLSRWFYKDRRPNRVATLLNRVSAAVHALGIAPNYLVALEIRGRNSDRLLTLPLVMARVDGQRYLVSMLGADASWVQNVRAAHGAATLRHGRREPIRLQEIPPEQRAPVLKAYLQRAPGARPHMRIDRHAPLSEFERVAPQFPVFRVLPRIPHGITQQGEDR